MTHYHVIASDKKTGEQQLSIEVLGDEGLRPYNTRAGAQAAADSLTASATEFDLDSIEYGVTDNCINSDCPATAEEDYPCAWCGGTGEIEPAEDDPDGETVKCSHCEGTGQASGE